MMRRRPAYSSSRCIALFDALQPHCFLDPESGRKGAEVVIALDDGDELSVHLSAIDGEAEVDAIAAARSALAQLKDLDARATGYLFDLPNWPHGDDARLWLLIVQHDNVRLCYSQVGVNDEQAIGFTLANGEWVLQGHDPRHRGDAPNPFDQKVNVPPAAASRSRPGSLR